MGPRSMKTSRIALPLLSLAMLVACSSSKGSGLGGDPTKKEPEDAGATGDAAKDSAPVDAANKDAAPAPDAAPTGECGAEVAQTACVSCCSNKHQDGAGTYFVALVDCMCLAGNCAKECAATMCIPDAPKNPDVACSNCVSAKNAACAASTTAACMADPACVAFDTCLAQSACPSKSN